MSKEPVDQLDSLNLEGKNTRDRIRMLSVILLVLFFAGGIIGFAGIIELIYSYFKFRHKWVLFEVFSLSVAASLSVLPFIAFDGWIRLVRIGRKANYFSFLGLSVLLYVISFILGVELLIALTPTRNPLNPLLPSYVIFPPFLFCYDLLFLVTSALSFLLVRLLTSKRSSINHTSNR